MSKRLDEIDFIGAGFEKVDHIELAHPPKIQWGDRYKKWPLEEKAQYLEKLACAMNHAAKKLQDERDYFGDLCEKKEKQINSLKIAIEQNNQMIQSEITKMNAERQQYNAAIAKLNAKVRELEGGNNS